MFNKYRAKHQFKTDTETFKYDEEIVPIKLRISFRKLYDQLKKYMEERDYINIYEYENYNELFGTKDQFELTFSIKEVDLEGVCILNLSLFDEFKKGSTYKKIKEIIKDVREYFALYIVN